MGFMNASCSFTRFRLLDAVSQDVWESIPHKLRQFALCDIDNSAEERAVGWTCFEDMLDTEWRTAPPDKGDYLCFALRQDTRRVPPAVLKKYFALALRDEKSRNAAQGKAYIARERKKELKEQVTLRLLQRYLPVPAVFDVLWATDRGEIWFTSTQNKMLDVFLEEFIKSFNLHLEQMTPHNLALRHLDEDMHERLATLEPTRFGESSPPVLDLDTLLGQEFLTWLWYQSDTAPGAFTDSKGQPFSVAMEQRVVVQGGEGDSLETASVSGALSPLREARFGLVAGKKVSRAVLRLEQGELAWQCALKAEDLSMNSLKSPKIDKDDDADDDALLLERVYLMENAVALLDSLYARFLALRLGATWMAESALMQEWMRRDV